MGGGGGGGGGGGYMTWLLLATEPSKVVAYPCHYKITILSSTATAVRTMTADILLQS